MKDMITLKKIQRLEKTCELIYHYISHVINNESNANVLHIIAMDEKKHYEHIKSITKVDVPPYRIYMWFFRWVCRILGITFGIKLIEKKEEKVILELSSISGDDMFQILLDDSQEHEQELLDIIDEERLNYLGSIVLGLNDALVELSGALAGFTFAFADTRLIAMTGLITGISAALSMTASEYLSAKADDSKEPLKSCIYTGIAYIVTVSILILPYLIVANPYIALCFTLGFALFIIAAFSYYMAVVREYSFKKRFIEMAGISIGVAIISFLVGLLVSRIL